MVEVPSNRRIRGYSQDAGTLGFGLLLLLFIQTLTVWLESIYKIGLTKLSLGMEAAGLLFVFSPLLVFLCPEPAQRRLLWGSLAVFLGARALLPWPGVVGGMIVGGVGLGAGLVLWSLWLSQPWRSGRGDAGIALGLALLLSIALRAWGATCDVTLSRSGAAGGWMMAGLALALFWNRSSAQSDFPTEQIPARGTLGPALGFAAAITVVYLVLSSPGVVEAWLGFGNTAGTVICVSALAGSTVLLLRGWQVSRAGLVVWNLLFGAALVGGILALRVSFPAAPQSPTVEVRPENALARLLLNLMFLLSPVVLCNAQAAARSLGEMGRARSLAIPLGAGFGLLVLLTLMSIFTHVWGYVGPVSAVFRNQFHLPFLLLALFMVGALCLPGWRFNRSARETLPASRALAGLTVGLMLAALAGAWFYRPVTHRVAGTPKQLTILTYNLQQGADLDGNRNWENQLLLINAINADLIGLQESDTARPSNGHVAAAKYFGAKLGYHIYYGPNTVSGTYGTAILSRFPLKNPRTFFTYSDQDEVGTAMAEIEIDGKTFAFFNSHPSGSIPRRCQAEELVRQAAAYEYVIAVGDYNATPQDESYRLLTARLKDSWAERHPEGVGRLHPVLRPRGAIRPHGSSGKISSADDTIAMPDRIDHIFLSQPLKVIDSFYLPAPASQTDHPAHWAVIAWD
jgi:endonuclease/exonuclease/phosphatase family metal-dependent hydrolase